MFSLRNILPQNRISLVPHLRLFDACVQPILLYGAEIWSFDYLFKNNTQQEKQYINFLPEKVHTRYLKIIMGLNRSAVNITVLSETGRFPLAMCAIKSTLNFWHHLTNSKENTVAKIAYNHSFRNNIGLCNKLQSFLNSLHFNHVWENQNTPSIKGLTRAITLQIKDRYIKFWRSCLTEGNSNFMSKLRCYNNIKQDYKLESYLLTNVGKKVVSQYIKLRISNSKLMIEEGRHKNISSKDRICPLCKAEVESEIHFITECPSLAPLRHKLYTSISDIVPDFNLMNNANKFHFIMSSNDYDISKTCINGVAEMYEYRLEKNK